jgi:SpoVK/Ycf46/Vps4 family AAA+-type ATPase
MTPPVTPSSFQTATRLLIQTRSKDDALAKARQIADSRGKPLQTISLAQVVSGYLRETEKRLLALLDTAEESGAILFFDEADALFGNRSDQARRVDPLIDVPFFIQCIENFPGPVIIAASSSHKLDEETLKRLQFTPEN